MIRPRHIAIGVGVAVVMGLTVQFAIAGGYLWRHGEGGLIRPHHPGAQIPVGYELSATGYVGSGITNAALETEIQAAFASWNAAFPSANSILYNYLGQTSIDDGSASGPEQSGVDGHNIITFTDPDIIFDDATLAFCLLSFVTSEVTITAQNADFDGDGVADFALGTYPAGTILDADIVFDGNKTFQVDGSSLLDVQAVMLHESGHCAGLSHSSVPDATMWPFANPDVATGRLVHPDDGAAIAWLYPSLISFGLSYGRITGTVTSGATGLPVVGAHVFAVDISSGEKISGAYTLDQGQYDLVVPFGTWYLRIEPLDGDPPGLDPERINPIVAQTTDRWFPEEFYNTAETNADDPQAAEPLTLGFFQVLEDVDLITNVAEVSARFLLVETGANYISYPVQPPPGYTAFDFLRTVAPDTGVKGLQRFDPQSGRFDLAQWHEGAASGIDFPLLRGEGYLLQTDAVANVGFEGDVFCPTQNLRAGFSLIGVPCAPAGYSAFDFLRDIGDPVLIESIRNYDRVSGQWQLASFDAGVPTGVDFAIEDGIGYALHMRYAVDNFAVNASGAPVPPALAFLSPGQGVAGAVVTLAGVGLSSDTAATTVSFGGVGAEVLEATPFSVTTRVPAAAQSGNVTATVNGLTSNPLFFEVLNAVLAENEGQATDLISGQTVTAAIDDVADIDEFNFVAIEGNLLTVRAIAATPGVPDLLLKLYGPVGGLLRREVSGSLGEANILNMAIPKTGYYRLTVESLDGITTGGYSLSFQLLGQANTPALYVLGGDNQTAVSGTQLPLPIEVIAAGAQGTPAAGIDVTLIVEDTPLRADGTLARAQSATQSSNSQGIVSTIVQSPINSHFVYRLTVQAPGMEPVAMRVAVIDEPIAAIEITGDGQTCTNGCPVGQPVDEDYSITYKDAQDQGIADVMTWWRVVSGRGTIEPSSASLAATADGVISLSDASGRTSVKHTLGEALFFDYDIADVQASLIPIPQQVAATVPGQAAPVVFTSIGKAGDPTRITWAGANHARINLGTAQFNALKIRATDDFDNPVAGVTVDVSPPGSMLAFPGLWSGGQFLTNQTDERGFYVSAIGAGIGDVIPTRDEFGNSGTPGLSPAYLVTVQIPSASVSDVFTVDVPMGPTLIASPQGANALIGQPLGQTVEIGLFRVQRFDDFTDDNNDALDDDGGNWSDEEQDNFLFAHAVALDAEPLIVKPRRADGHDLAAVGLTGSTINGVTQLPVNTDVDGMVMLDNVRLGAVGGSIDLIIRTQGVIQEEFFHDAFLPGQTGQSLGVLPFEPETIALKMFADPVIISIPLIDKFPDTGVTLGSADPYPGIGEVSGVDLSKLSITLNTGQNEILFGYSSAAAGPDPQALGIFPNYRTFVVDGNSVSKLDDVVKNLRPAEILFTYRPTADELMSTNDIFILEFSDRVGNDFEDEMPPVLPFNFPYP